MPVPFSFGARSKRLPIVEPRYRSGHRARDLAVERRRGGPREATPPVRSSKTLENQLCDLVVHADHGIGRYTGLKKLALGPYENDFMVLEFAGTDKLYLPVYALGRLQKYSGGGQGSPRVDKLGGTAWQKVRAKAKKSAEEDALAMLDLYARREMAVGYRFSQPDDFSCLRRHISIEETPIKRRPLRRSWMICADHDRWIAYCVGMSDLAKQKSRCARR